MIPFQSFILDNGLRVIVHEDPDCLLATVNLMYYVGSKDEDPKKTGFAHLFEHLMFGGSKNIPSYDHALQQVGGDNNAYTSPDVTNYYCVLPANNLETAFWLESDRMLSLAFDKRVLATQQKVVIEEFKETYLNQPYGDAWLKLSELAYTIHPYRWPVIGREIAHIEQVTIEDIKDFFKRFYIPNNAVLVVAGKVEFDQVKRLSKKWFGPIPAGIPVSKRIPQEPIQQFEKTCTVYNNVPLNAIYKAFPMPGQLHKDYYAIELLCNALGGSKSARLYEHLIEKHAYFNTIGAHITETIDPGLLIIVGRLNEGVSFQQADEALGQVLDTIKTVGLSEQELEKVKNVTEASRAYAAVDLLHRAQELAFYTLLGNTNLINEEALRIQAVSLTDIQYVAENLFKSSNSNTLYYQRLKN
jgi:zinc protease